jgi:hypothetical protein
MLYNIGLKVPVACQIEICNCYTAIEILVETISLLMLVSWIPDAQITQ